MKKKKHSAEDEAYLSLEELALLRASEKQSGEDRSQLPPFDTSDRANTLRFAKRNPLFIASLVVILSAVLAACIFGAVMLVRYLDGKPSRSDFTVYLGEESYKADYEHLMREDILYLDMKKIATFSGMIISGSEKKIKFTASDDQYLRFENDSEFAVINGNKVEMPVKAIVNKDECLVPFSFLQKVISQGLRLRWNTENNVIRITRQRYTDDTHAEMLFVTDGFFVIQSLKTEEELVITAADYPIDIEPYLSYINPSSMSDLLILANKQNALGEDYAPTDLVGLQGIGIESKNADQQLRSSAAYALQAMLRAMATENAVATENLIVTSSYRSYTYQHWLYYNTYVQQYLNEGYSQEEAEAKASEYSARPGESEHQTGLCFDFIIRGENLDESFENTAAFAWLSENAHLYGYILRYPKDKTNITGYTYEPWHYRFVGRDAAVTIYQTGLTLEEYLDLN